LEQILLEGKMIKIIAGNISSRIIELTDPILIQKLDEELSFDVVGAAFSPKYQKGYWDGRKHFFSKKALTFPTGLLHRVKTVFKQSGVPYDIELPQLVQPGSELPFEGVKLYDWQENIVQTCLQEHRGMIQMATGAGKTLTFSALTAKLNVPTLITVHKRDLLYQTKEVLEKHIKQEIGLIGDGKVNIKKITVAMLQTLGRAFKVKLTGFDEKDNTKINNPNDIQDLVKNTDCLIADEAHHLSAPVFYNVMKYCGAYYRFGWTATCYRESHDDMMFEAIIGPKIAELNASELIRKGFLSKPKIYFVPFKHHKVHRNLDYKALYEQEVVDNTERNKKVVELGYEAYRQGKKVLIAVTYIRHGSTLELMFKELVGDQCKYMHGNVETMERMQTLKELDTGVTPIVIATDVYSEGVNCPGIDVLINAKAQKSAVSAYQLLGRALRKTVSKDKVIAIDFWDYGCRYLEQHAKARYSIYSTEPEFEIKQVKET
jgi:superfamily II DNA or RNA helicase